MEGFLCKWVSVQTCSINFEVHAKNRADMFHSIFAHTKNGSDLFHTKHNRTESQNVTGILEIQKHTTLSEHFKLKNCRKYPQHTYTGLLNFLAWYSHFNKK
jgi:hypothetical protein